MPNEIDSLISSGLNKIIHDVAGDSVNVIDGSVHPLTGGFDTEVYALAVPRNESLPEQLVLRMFKGEHEARRAVQEGAIHNAAANNGHRVPRVFAGANGEVIADRPFLLMERVKGASLLSAIDDRKTLALIPQIMARSQAGINSLSSDGLITLLRKKGIDTDRLAVLSMVDEIADIANRGDLSEIIPLVDWLKKNKPDDPSVVSICHGDFHPGNIMVMDSKITGIIDWATVRFGHAEYDVSVTRMLLKIGATAREDIILSESDFQLIDQVVNSYVNEYQKFRPLNNNLLRYYETLRAAHALVRVIARESGSAIRQAAPDGYAWGSPQMRKAITGLILDSTGIEIA